jgi:hypothetical protein
MELNDLEFKEQCQLKVSNTFTVLENLDDDDDNDDDDVGIYRVWESITE